METEAKNLSLAPPNTAGITVKNEDSSTTLTSTPQTVALTSTTNSRKRKSPPTEDEPGIPSGSRASAVVVVVDQDQALDDEDADADADAEAEAEADAAEADKQGTEHRRHSPHPHVHAHIQGPASHPHSPQLSHHSGRSPSNSPSPAHSLTHPTSTRSPKQGSVPGPGRAVGSRARSASSSSSTTAAPHRPGPSKGDGPGQGEYENGHVVCESCNTQVSFRDEKTGGFSLEQWTSHRKTCTGQAGNRSPGPPEDFRGHFRSSPGHSRHHPTGSGHPSSLSPTTRSRHPPSPHSFRPSHPSSDRDRQREIAMYNTKNNSVRSPHIQTRSSLAHLQPGPPSSHLLQSHPISSPTTATSLSHPHVHTSLTTLVHETLTQTPVHPPTKRRRAKRTEEERIAYLRADPYVAQFEPYKVLCASCDKWIRLRPNSTYCSIPWDAHRKSCLSKKISSKNTYALEERNSLFAKDPDIRKFDAERVLCAVCDHWIQITPEDHLRAVQTWIAHRSDCAKRHAGAIAAGVGGGVGGGLGNVEAHRPTHMPPQAASGSPVLPPLMTQDQRNRHSHPHPHPHPHSYPHPMNSSSQSHPGPHPQSHPSSFHQRPPHEQHHPHQPDMVRPGPSSSTTAAEKPSSSRTVSGGIQIKQQEMDDDLPASPAPAGEENKKNISDGESDADADADVDVDADADPDIDADGDPEVMPQSTEANQRGSPAHSTASQQHSQTSLPPSAEAQQQQQQQQDGEGEVIYSPAAGIFPPGPAHESRRRNAEQRAATLRADKLIKHVEANRVFCRLCEKWVQLRQDSSYCAYPWLQHRGKCLARYQRRAQKAVEIAEIKARRANHAYGHGLPSSSSMPPSMHHDHPSHHPPHDAHRSHTHPYSSHGPYMHPSSSSRSSRYPRHYSQGDEDELMSDGEFDTMGMPGMGLDIDIDDEDDLTAEEGYPRYSHGARRVDSVGSGDDSFLVQDDNSEDGPPVRNRSHPHPHYQNAHFSGTAGVPSRSHTHRVESHAPSQGQGRGGVYGSSAGGRQPDRISGRHEPPSSRAANSGNEADADDAEDDRDEDVGRESERARREEAEEEDVEMTVEGEGDHESSNPSQPRMPQRSHRHRSNTHVSAQRYAGRTAPNQRQHQLVPVQPRGGGGGYPNHAGPSGYSHQQPPYGHPLNPYSTRNIRSSHSAHGRPYPHGSIPSGSNASFAANVAGGTPRKPVPAPGRALADLDSLAGRRQFVSHSISYLFQTTYEYTDDLSISTLLTYLNAAMPVDKHEDFDTAEVVKAVVVLQEKGKILFEGDLVKRIRSE